MLMLVVGFLPPDYSSAAYGLIRVTKLCVTLFLMYPQHAV